MIIITFPTHLLPTHQRSPLATTRGVASLFSNSAFGRDYSTQLFINGEFVDSKASEFFDVL